MAKKLTITVSDAVYAGLQTKIGAGRISRFIDTLARPHVVATMPPTGTSTAFK